MKTTSGTFEPSWTRLGLQQTYSLQSDITQKTGVKRISAIRDLPTLRPRFHTLFAQDPMHDFSEGIVPWFLQLVFRTFNRTEFAREQVAARFGSVRNAISPSLRWPKLSARDVNGETWQVNGMMHECYIVLCCSCMSLCVCIQLHVGRIVVVLFLFYCARLRAVLMISYMFCSFCCFVASQSMGMFFALPIVMPDVFSVSNSVLSSFAEGLYELMQIVFSSVLDDKDLERCLHLSQRLLVSVPSVFVDFGDKPKFHYGFAHIHMMLQRHGPTPFWSSFAFESRLGDLKKACLLVANNKSVWRRGGDLIMEMFALHQRQCVLNGTTMPLFDWACNRATACTRALSDALHTEPALRGLELQVPVIDVRRFEGLLSAFSTGAYVGKPSTKGPPYVTDGSIYLVTTMCLVQGVLILSCLSTLLYMSVWLCCYWSALHACVTSSLYMLILPAYICTRVCFVLFVPGCPCYF